MSIEEMVQDTLKNLTRHGWENAVQGLLAEAEWRKHALASKRIIFPEGDGGIPLPHGYDCQPDVVVEGGK